MTLASSLSLNPSFGCALVGTAHERRAGSVFEHAPNFSAPAQPAGLTYSWRPSGSESTPFASTFHVRRAVSVFEHAPNFSAPAQPAGLTYSWRPSGSEST